MNCCMCFPRAPHPISTDGRNRHGRHPPEGLDTTFVAGRWLPEGLELATSLPALPGVKGLPRPSSKDPEALNLPIKFAIDALWQHRIKVAGLAS